MNACPFSQLLRLSITRIVASFSLIILLTACDTPAASSSGATSVSSSSTPSYATGTTITTRSPHSLDVILTTASANVGSLFIQSGQGFQCPYGAIYEQTSPELGHLVLASDRLTYSQDEIAQMKEYLEQGGAMNGSEPPPPLPSTLRWVIGGETTQVPGTPPVFPPYSDLECQAFISVQNIGSTPIQIAQIGTQLQMSPQQNTYQYRLIDVCGFALAQLCVNPGSAGGGGCSVYYASIKLGMGKENEVFSAIPTGNPGCNMPTLAPGTQISFALDLFPAPAIPQNLIYSIMPVFTLETVHGKQTVSIPQLRSTLAFAKVSQFSCYGLQGTTFVLEQSPAFSLTSLTPIPGEKGHWCL